MNILDSVYSYGLSKHTFPVQKPLATMTTATPEQAPKNQEDSMMMEDHEAKVAAVERQQATTQEQLQERITEVEEARGRQVEELVEKIAKVEGQLATVQGELGMKEGKIMEVQGQLQEREDRLAEIQERGETQREDFLQKLAAIEDKLATVQEQQTEKDAQIAEVREQLQQKEERMAETEGKLREKGEKMDAMQDQLQAVNEKVDLQKKQIELLHVRIHNVGTDNTPPLPAEFVVEKFTEFAGKGKHWDSCPPFYTHIMGAKIRIRLAMPPAGPMRIELIQMVGKFDHELNWPIRCAVTVQVLNQRGNQGNLDHSSNFQLTRPSKDTHAGSVSFIGYAILHQAQGGVQYLKNDCLRFRVSVRFN